MSKIGLSLLTVLVFAVIGCENKEIIMDNGLIIEDIIIGVGTTAEKYSIATVHYTGKLENGTVFDSSKKRECDFEQALRWFSPGFGHQFRQAIAGMNKHENASFRICLDLLLNEYIANPRFCVEVFPDSGVQEARTLTLAKQLQITQHFPKSALEDIENVHHKLPCGKTRA